MTNKTLEIGRILRDFINELEKGLVNIEELSSETDIRIITTTSRITTQKIYTENYYALEKKYNSNFSNSMSQATKVYILLLKQAHESALLEIKEDYNSLNDETYEKLKLKYRFDEK